MKIKEDKKSNPYSKRNIIALRLSDEDFKIVVEKASLYTRDNLSQWIRYAATRMEPKKKDLE